MARPAVQPRLEVASSTPAAAVSAKERSSLREIIAHHWSQFFESDGPLGKGPRNDERSRGVEMTKLSDNGEEAKPGRLGVVGELHPPSKQSHLVVLVHGLAGDENDWGATYELATAVPALSHMLFYTSTANGRERTLAGIHVCGDRLVEELRRIVSSNLDLTQISFIAHSMGGLISRYAIGRLYDTKADTILGLKPVHFLTMATPHLGCDAAGITKVPLLEWAGMVPLVQQTMCSVAAPVTGLVLGLTGKQFFLQDTGTKSDSGPFSGRQPLIEALAYDHPADDLYFFSALQAFQTRTAYANVRGDHLVSWANSSLRFAEQLPIFADDSADVIDIQCTMSDGDLDEPCSKAAVEDEKLPSGGRVEGMLRKLQELPWNRVDVRFKDPSYFLAHNHIQVTSKLINGIGLPITRHLVNFLAQMESTSGAE